MPKAAEECIWAWVHVSDIHGLHGSNAWRIDQRLVLEALIDDIPRGLGLGAPRPGAVVCTGDVAATGGVARADEYQLAAEWLKKVLAASGASELFCVPGNHDVQRARSTDRGPYRLIYW